MRTVVSIVEGDGEVAALPVLLRRVAAWLTPDLLFRVERPIRVRKDQFLNRSDWFASHVRLAAAKCGEHGWILILLDADDDCPAECAAAIAARASAIAPDREISVVLPNKEYEAWFLAGARSLHGVRGFACPQLVPDAELLRGTKQWIGRHKRGGYHEVADQPALSARMDLQLVHDNSRSFRKLCGDWAKFAGRV